MLTDCDDEIALYQDLVRTNVIRPLSTNRKRSNYSHLPTYFYSPSGLSLQPCEFSSSLSFISGFSDFWPQMVLMNNTKDQEGELGQWLHSQLFKSWIRDLLEKEMLDPYSVLVPAVFWQGHFFKSRTLGILAAPLKAEIGKFWEMKNK